MPDAHLSRAVARIESAGNPYALRFEPHVLERYGRLTATPREVQAARTANKCSIDTAEVICSTSWGLYQIMGFNLYRSPGPSIGAFLNSRELQEQAFGVFLERAGQDRVTGAALLADKSKRDAFARAYNGPGNIADYSAKLLAALKATQ